MTELSQQQHDLAEIQEHIDEYADSKAAWGEDPIDWYIKCHAELSADEAAVRAKRDYLKAAIDRESGAMLGELARRRRGLDWKHKEETIQLVAARIEGKKQRHVKTFHGRAGFKKKPATTRLNVFDEKALFQAHASVFDSKPVVNRAALKERLMAGDRMAGMAWLEETPEQDMFYVDTGKKELPPAQPQVALPEKGSV